MKLAIMGTGPFAVPMFESLATGPDEICGLITRPVIQGRGRTAVVNPMADAAKRLGVEVHSPQSANSSQTLDLLSGWVPDVLVVCDYGQILSAETLAAARLGCINLHGSLLPKYRGAAPVQWAILQGDEETGVTVIHMNPRLDAGPILSSRQLAIGPAETHEELEPRLAALGVEPVIESLEMLRNWDGQSPIGTPQDASHASKAPRLSKSQGRIDWCKTTQQIMNQVRAFKPWPGSYTFAPRSKGDPQRLLIDLAEAIELSEADQAREPGEVIRSDAEQLAVRTGDGAVSILRLQPAGKRLMNIDEFLRGRPPKQGAKLG
jgi:methionyl-tRNA formyltransferase